jgi:hypothetical protein
VFDCSAFNLVPMGLGMRFAYPSLLLALVLAPLIGAPTASPVAAAADDPGAAVPAQRYLPVFQGSRSYRPVEPLPWGDVNRRVAPPSQPRTPPPRRAPEAGPEPKP